MEIATNITQRKTMHQALTEEKERLSVILRSIGDGVIATDIAGRVILANTAAETLTGWTHEEAMGCSLSQVFTLIDGTTRETVENPLDLVMTGNGVADRIHHAVLVSQNGLERSIAFKGSPIKEDSGRVIGIVIAFSDISDRLRMEEELIKGKKLESIGVLAGGIAHDFNNILAVILGNVDFALTLTDSGLSDESRELLDDAVKACIRAQGLTKQLLTFAKGGEPVMEASSLTDVIMDSANFILHGDKTACRYDFPDDLWMVEIDKGQISQVVQNIILNASQAMPWGGIVDVAAQNVMTADIPELDGRPDTRYVKVSFRDRGVGIPITVIDRIFDPYFSTKQQGSGLGLAISHSIIRKHNGLISVKSTPGEGTTFIVYLPATRLDVRLSVKTLPELRPDKRVKILVMDDQEQILKMTERMLSKMGHTVVRSRDGKEAVALYRTEFEKGEPFDFTIMDLTIPGGMGGREAVVEIHAVNPHARVLVSSGYSNDPVMANHGDYGFCGTIVKPFQLNELKQILRNLIDEG
jgi:PAS domain S-box-containing protein